MEETLISFETAKLAKEKDFKFRCDWVYNQQGDKKINYLIENNEIHQAPTQSILQRWLREGHNVHCLITPFVLGGVTKYEASTLYEWAEEEWTPNIDKDSIFNTYEEALEDALKTGLEVI